MWSDTALFAAQISFRQMAIGMWLLVLFGFLGAWLWRWVMDDSR